MAIIRVPLDYPTIQEGVNAASFLDTVRISAAYSGPKTATVSTLLYIDAPAEVTGVNIYTVGTGSVRLQGAAPINLYGSEINNVFEGNDGFNIISAGGGNDTVTLSAGADNIDGGSGNDTFSYGASAVSGTLVGGDGVDTLSIFNLFNADYTALQISGVENLALRFNEPTTGMTVQQLASFSAIYVTEGAGSLNFSVSGAGGSLNLGSRLIDGNNVSANFSAVSSAVNVTAGVGSDVITGTNFSDVIYGGGGSDTLIGGNGGDLLFGGLGADQHVGGDGPGVDYARYDDANYGNLVIRLDGGLGTGAAAGDSYVGIEGLTAGAGNDTVIGNSSANVLNGNAGADDIRGGGSNDVMIGGLGGDMLFGGAGADQHVGGDDAGIDYARYDDANYGNLVIRLDGGAGVVGAAVGDTYSGIEGLISGAGNDFVIGNTARNYLWGGNGNDTLNGLSGNDFMNGGAGADRFQFTTALGASNVDTIDSFAHGLDDIVLSRAIFTDIGTTLDVAEFGADADNFIIYDQATGRLSFDANGAAGGAAPVHFATVTAGTVLDINDFVML